MHEQNITNIHDSDTKLITKNLNYIIVKTRPSLISTQINTKLDTVGFANQPTLHTNPQYYHKL